MTQTEVALHISQAILPCESGLLVKISYKVGFVIWQRSGHIKIAVDSCVFRFGNREAMFLWSYNSSAHRVWLCSTGVELRSHLHLCVWAQRMKLWVLPTLFSGDWSFYKPVCVCEAGLRVHLSDGNDLQYVSSLFRTVITPAWELERTILTGGKKDWNFSSKMQVRTSLCFYSSKLHIRGLKSLSSLQKSLS